MSPIRYLRQLVAPTGRHRAMAPASARVPIEDLLGPWPPATERAHGAAVVQAWDDCEPCGKATAGVLHKDGWTCGECLTSAPAGGAA
jgi:ribosomal protein S27AE